MSPKWLPQSFGSNQLTSQEQIWFEDFQDGPCGGHLGYWNRMILAILNFYVALMPLIEFWLNPTHSLRDVVWEFQDGGCGGQLGYQNGTILAILNFHISQMPPTKFQLNRIYCLAADVIWRFSRWPPWISEPNDFSNSESVSLWCLPWSFG